MEDRLSVTLTEAQADLAGLIKTLSPGKQVIITDNCMPIATIIAAQPTSDTRRVPGIWKGKVTILADDEDHSRRLRQVHDVKLLVDTHALVWFAMADAQLAANARSLIEDPANEVLVSPASYWEIAIKVYLGKCIWLYPIPT